MLKACNPYQATSNIFHRTRTNNFKICMEIQKTLNSQSNLDDCGFVVEPEVRQVDSSSTILLSQDCFGYLSFFFFFVFAYKL